MDENRETHLAMLQAFSDETARQRKINGWEQYPLPSVVEWPVAEQDAGIAALRAAFTVQWAMKMREEWYSAAYDRARAADAAAELLGGAKSSNVTKLRKGKE